MSPVREPVTPSPEKAARSLRTLGRNEPIRVVRPVVSLGILLLVLLFVGMVAAVPAILLAMVASVAGLPLGWAMLGLWLPVMIGFVIRTKLAEKKTRYTLYEDRLFGEWPHPRKLGLHMQEANLRADHVTHLNRRDKSIVFERRDGSVGLRIDLPSRQEVDGFWADLLAWRERAGGLYSISEAADDLRHSRPDEVAALIGGAAGPQLVRLERDSPFLTWFRTDDDQLRLEDLGGPLGEQLDLRWPRGLNLKISTTVAGHGNRGTLTTREGVVLGSWRSTGIWKARLLFCGRHLEMAPESLSEDGVAVAELTRSFGYLKSVRFLSESPRTAMLLALLCALPSAAHDVNSSTRRKEPTPLSD